MGIDQTHFLSEKMVFTCWPGGTNGASKVDFSPLAGRDVVLMPDFDLAGFKCLRGEKKSFTEYDKFKQPVNDADDNDTLWVEALEIILTDQKASISSLQRKLRVGYNRAARLLEKMESAKVIDEMTSDGQRKVLHPLPEKAPSKPGVIDYIKTQKPESINFVIPENDRVKGWDIADNDGTEKGPAWGQGELADWIKARTRKRLSKHPLEKLEKENKKENSTDSKSDAVDNSLDHNQLIDIQNAPDTDDAQRLDLSDLPFRVLGYNRDKRYYMPHSTQQIVDLSAAGHVKNQFMNLAPLEYWLRKFGDGHKTRSINWDIVANQLFKMSSDQGLFDPKNSIRGRGAWLDSGRSVLHLGEDVFVDGEKLKPEDVESKFIYEKNHGLGFEFADAASDAESKQLIDILSGLSWENPLSAYLMAGWCVLAPVCGILKWRPHVWITGPSGSGKSTVLDNVVKPLLADFVIKTEGATSEAGIRQTIGADARPVIFDEAEAEDKASAQRMQDVLKLARVASSGGIITKGSQDGGGVSYTVRSCFCFAAINPSVKHLADENRISQLVLNKSLAPGAEDKYKILAEHIKKNGH